MTVGTFTLQLSVITGVNGASQSAGMKYQVNIFTNEVKTYGLSGDIAGNVIKNIQGAKDAR